MTIPLSNLHTYQVRAAKALDRLLPAPDSRLHQAMRYAAQGGKNLRAALLYAAADSLNSGGEALDYAAAAIESLHSYSLIHDDLPAMDDDDFRRGQPSTHKAFDEAEAILAGDALNTLAFELLAQSPLPDAIKIQQIFTLAHAAGSRGMAGGQSLDIIHTGRSADLAALQQIHSAKTGALIHAALTLGALPASDYAKYQPRIDSIGSHLGLAYQIQDDILDATADSQILGKTAGKDAAQSKTTYISLLGLENSQKHLDNARGIIAQHCTALPNPAPLANLIDAIFNRQH